MKSYFEIVDSGRLESYTETAKTSIEVWVAGPYVYHCLWFTEFRELPLTIRRELSNDRII